MFTNKTFCFHVTEITLQQKRRLINKVNSLKKFNHIILICEDSFFNEFFLIDNNIEFIPLERGKIKFYKNSLVLRKLLLQRKLDVLHFYGVAGVFSLVPWLKHTSDIALCFDFCFKNYSVGVKVILRSFIKRFDHLFIPSRLSNDDVWVNLRMPPSRCTSLSLSDLITSEEVYQIIR